MKRTIIVLFLLLVLLPSLFATRSEEFLLLKNEIEERHKNFFNTYSKEYTEAIWEELSEGIEEKSLAEYYFTLSSFLALSSDSHTFLSGHDIYSHFFFFPLQLNYIGDKAYVVSGLEEYSAFMGKEVDRINGWTIAEIEEKGASVFPHDNKVYLRQNLNNALNNTSFLSFIGNMESPEGEVTVTFRDGERVTLSPMKAEEIQRGNLTSARKIMNPYIYNDYYRATEIEDGVLLISYNTCTENDAYPISSFKKDLEKVLKAKKYSTIIVDLRYNGGGNSSVLNPIIKLLKKQKGNKYCLIGENTFSSAILNAVSLKEDAGFTLVGSPTGGSINHFGELGCFTLEESGWDVYYSTKYFRLSKKYEGSIRPDILVEETIESYIWGRDSAIEYILSSLSSR